MNVRKVIKKIATVGVVAGLLVGSTLTGAFAASTTSDLMGLPAPFVQNGAPDFQVVLGQGAAVQDVLGAIDISNAFQANSISESVVDIPGQTTTTVDGGVKIESAGNHLLINEALNSAKSKFDKSDLPKLLADGTVVEEDDNTDFDYDQEIVPGAGVSVQYDKDPSGVDDPMLYLDFNTGTKALWNYTLDFKGTGLNLSEVADSETIEMLGKVFTFGSSITKTGEVTLFGSDTTTFLSLNQPQTIVVDGSSYEIEVVGGNSDRNEIVLAVNGVRKTLSQSETKTVGGVEIYVKDVFVTDIPTLDASATVFVGSQKVILQAASATANTCSMQGVEINGDTLNRLKGCVMSSSTGRNEDVDKIRFQFLPAKSDDNLQQKFAIEGETIVDPLFGTFEVNFAGETTPMDDSSKNAVTVERSGDELEVTFTNDDGDEISFKPYKMHSSSTANVNVFSEVTGEDGWIGVANESIATDDVFALTEGTGTTKNTKVYEVAGFKTDNSVDYVRLEDLGSGDISDYKVGDQIGDAVTDGAGTAVTVVAISTDSELLNLSSTANVTLFLEGGKNYLTLTDVAANTQANQTITYTESDSDETSTGTLVIRAQGDDGNDELDLFVSRTGTWDGGADDGNDNDMYVSSYGTYYTADTESDGRSIVKFWSPVDKDAEVYYDVFVAPIGAAVITSGGSNSITTQSVNPVAVGAAVLDVDVQLATANKNLVVVGGPCINSVAAELLGNPAVCSEGFEPGKALIELFDLDNGKVAMLVAGYEALETQAASRAVATTDARLSGDAVSLTVTSLSDYSIAAKQ
jgi:hypothetical protein